MEFNLRPCIVFGNEYEFQVGKGFTKAKNRKRKGLFHCWTEQSSCTLSGTQIVKKVALVEYEDGTIHKCLPDAIKFVDKKFFELDLSFPEL